VTHFLLNLKSVLTPVNSLHSNYHNHSQPLHRPVPLVLHLSDDQAVIITFRQHVPRQPSVHALAVRPSPKDGPSADGLPVAAHTLWAVGDAYRAPAAGSEPLPRLVALAALALAYPLVFDLVRIVLLPHDAAPVRVVIGYGLGSDRRARERERPGTRRREPHDAQEGRRAPRARGRVMNKCARECAGVCALDLSCLDWYELCVRGGCFCSLCFVSLFESCEVGRMRIIQVWSLSRDTVTEDSGMYQTRAILRAIKSYA
jgi:hypothetical protein